MLCTLEHARYLHERGSRRWLQPHQRSICRRSRQPHLWGVLLCRSPKKMMQINSWRSGLIGRSRSQWRDFYYHLLRSTWWTASHGLNIYTSFFQIALTSSHECCFFSAGRNVRSEFLGSLLDNDVRCETQVDTGVTLSYLKSIRNGTHLSSSELQKRWCHRCKYLCMCYLMQQMIEPITYLNQPQQHHLLRSKMVTSIRFLLVTLERSSWLVCSRRGKWKPITSISITIH